MVVTAYDDDDDGSVDRESLVGYRADGQPGYLLFDGDGDNVCDGLGVWHYDSRGLLVRYVADVGADGTIDRSEWYEYDEHGRLTRYSYDYDGDSLVDGALLYYYAGGRLVRVESDENGDGAIEWVSEYVYDQAGQQTAVTTRAADGRLRSRELWFWDDGLLLREERYRGEALTLFAWIIRSYDSQRRLVRQEKYEELGTPAHTYLMTYDDAGRLARMDYIVHGVIHRSWLYSYDRWGRILSEVGTSYSGAWRILYSYGDGCGSAIAPRSNRPRP